MAALVVGLCDQAVRVLADERKRGEDWSNIVQRGKERKRERKG